MRVIGYSDAIFGSEIQESTHMDAEDVLDTLNSMLSAGFIESIPYKDEVDLETMPTTQFEINPSYAHDIKAAARRR